MKFDDLQGKIRTLISEYNKGLDEYSDDRVTTAQLHLARPAAACTEDTPGLVHVTPPEFAVEAPQHRGHCQRLQQGRRLT